MELLWRDSLICPSEEDYIAMVKDSKTRHGNIFHPFRFQSPTNIDPSLPLLDSMVYCVWGVLETGGLLRLAVKLMQAASDCQVYVFMPFLLYSLLIKIARSIAYHG
jgi:hypothetical protein